MNKLLRHIHEHSVDGLHCALIIGAGTGSQLSDWRRLGYHQLLLVEAHPRVAEELGSRLHYDRGERLLAIAATPTEQPITTLETFNHLAYSSLKKAAELFTYYPNLRHEEVLQVPARSLESVVAEQMLDHQQPHALLIAAPGQALQLLQATPEALLHAFTWIIIECSSEPLYQDDAKDSEIIGWMEGLGFDLVMDNPDAIFPQSQILFERNATRLGQQRSKSEVAKLDSQSLFAAQASQQQLLQLEQQIDDLVSENTRLVSACEALEVRQAELIKARDDQIDLAISQQAQINAFDNERSELANACEALTQKNAALSVAYDNHATQVTDLQGEIASLGNRNAELVRTKEVLDKQLVDLAGARDAQAQLANERQARVDVLSKASSGLAAERDALAKDNAKLTQTCEAQTRLAIEYKVQLDKVSEQCGQLQKAMVEQKKAFDANQGYVQTLEREAMDYQHRHRLLEEELLKSEAQLDLIKDLLLREPGL